MNYHNITHNDMNNGDGLRTVLWVSGCDHHCYNCQNPQTWDKESGIKFDEEAKQEIFDSLENDYISGLTITGGDPLFTSNLLTIFKLIVEVKQKYPNKSIWLYTGYTFEEICNDMNKLILLAYVDVLVDGEYVDSERDVTLKWRGSKNQRVIDVDKTLVACDNDNKELKVVLYCD